MGFLKSLFGGGTSKPAKPSKPASIPRTVFTPVGDAVFTPTSDDATFELVKPNEGVTDATFETLEDIGERAIREAGATAEEEAYLLGNPVNVTSSNVAWIQYLWRGEGPNGQPLAGPELNLLYIGFLDGSSYEYSDVTFDEALDLYRAGSKGKWVWRELRILGTVFGFKKNYRLVEGNRVWHAAGADSIARHQAVPPSGEPYKSWHPSMNYKAAKGPMGAEGGGVNLGKKGGSRKVAHFIPKAAKPKFGSRP